MNKYNDIIYLDRLGKLNYYINNKPKMYNYNYEIYKFNKINNNVNITLNKKISIVLELYLTRAASNYALLGLEYEYLNRNALDIEIFYTKENEFNYKSNLLTEYLNEYVYCGLNEEYLKYILKSVNNFIDCKNLNISGKLKINISANSELGSSGKIFYFIAEILLSILYDLLNISLTSKELIQNIIEENFKKINSK